MFKVGDKVVLNPDSPHGAPQDFLVKKLERVKFLTISRVGGKFVYIEGFDVAGNGYFHGRFKLYKEPVLHGTYKQFYAEAKRLGIAGRSRMNKEALRAAIINRAGVVANPQNKPAVEPVKPLPEPLEVVFRKKVGSEKKEFVSGEICCYAFEHEGKRSFYNMHYCHASMNCLYADKVVEDIAKLHICHRSPDLYAEFADWFVNESLFAPAFVTKNWREASMVLNMDMTVNRIVSTQVALRNMYECQGKLDSWKFFVDKGYHKNVALLLSQLFMLTDGQWSRASIGNGHSIFSDNHKIKDIIRFFKEPWYNEKSTNKLGKGGRFSVWGSFAPVSGYGNHLTTFVNRYYVTERVGEGWDAKLVVNVEKIFECAAYVQELYDRK
jgi:hypothetical protein